MKDTAPWKMRQSSHIYRPLPLPAVSHIYLPLVMDGGWDMRGGQVTADLLAVVKMTTLMIIPAGNTTLLC